MKLTYIFLLLFFIACASNSPQNVILNNTKWIYEYDNDNISYFLFKDTLYEFFDAESGDTTFGKYYVINDSVIIKQFYGAFDENFTDYSRHRTPKTQFIMLIRKGNQLGFAEQWDANNQIWSDSFYFFKIY
jgi:hypothetical protein